ncbi:ABC-2 type transporter [Dimargaris cristalligena]|uniref:ABC-2 type transporter n=1 Tax=Dimargaris cristalligena TaxID=215637 RepID=A0A4V1J4T7_9FUNG|nr:ABC-2 type transporter [Dimargaris cristalligena]|eukprot:RKP36699.1 ABC-2 type transporter [Dimargaris cristalligena]
MKLTRSLLSLEREQRLLAASPAPFHDSASTHLSPSSDPWSSAVEPPPFPPAAQWGAHYAPGDRPEDCPPCFNCLLPAYKCGNFADCNQFNGRCDCPAGFGGDSCADPVCQSLAEGSQRKVREGESCECSEGWDGINCNVCQTDQFCNALMPEGINGTCYKGGLVVKENFQMCNVTNRKILDMLPGEPPQVTFSCNRDVATCSFQFWIKELESFYCKLSECHFSEDRSYDRNSTYYQCDKVSCDCMADRKLCGEAGSIDITDFLREEIEGPATFECHTKEGCRFEEPAMNDLILSVFGDSYITLACDSGECLHYTQVPGFERPPKPSNMLFILVSVVSGLALLIALGFGLLYLAKARPGLGSGYTALPPDEADDERDKLMAQHVEATLSFKEIGYSIGNEHKPILHSVNGLVQPGQIMAIMGASGAGKTTFLDILARRNKSGTVFGEVLVNGQLVDDAEYKRVVGFVDQEDTLMPTLTVYETILYSALLRLPRDMSHAAKRTRVLETMRELGIMDIKDSRIGSSTSRGISGGEKRRVSIACELVTSPSILFLDEPTSGLDAYNAYNVVECLVNLARSYQRTIVFTIHQPRSNIYALFDQLVLLAEGHMVYSGPARACQPYFESLGHPCPPGFNIADFVVDLTKHASRHNGGEGSDLTRSSLEVEEDGLSDSHPDAGSSIPLLGEFRATMGHSDTDQTNLRGGEASTHLLTLVQQYRASVVNEDLVDKMDRLRSTATMAEVSHSDGGSRNDDTDNGTTVVGSSSGGGAEQRLSIGRLSSSTKSFTLTAPRRPSWATQFTILADRTFRNLVRDPLLLMTHYIISIFLAILCGMLFYQVSDDISGFQNRMGVFFFLCALFGFSCMTSLQTFATERVLFMRERANGYYAPITYFGAKVIFDIFPLRVIPPLLLGAIVYPMVGLVSGADHFAKFVLVLVLFNLASASICLCIGIICRELSVANLLSSLVMLFSMLFGGLLLNKDSIPYYMGFLKDLSIFNYALESMIVNEMKYLQLREKKFGLEIDVPGATILSTFGFNAANYWPDVTKLGAMFLVFILVSFICLQVLVKEKR